MADRPTLYHEADLFEIILHHSPPAFYDEETHDTVQICIPYKGARYDVRRLTEGGSKLTHRLAAGDILVVPAHQPHAIDWQQPADILSMHLSSRFLANVLGTPKLELRDTLVLHDQFIGQAAMELRRAAIAQDTPEALLGAFATMIAYRIGRSAETELLGFGGAPRALSPGERARIDQHVAIHMEGSIRLGDLAELVGLSQWHFLRRFQATEGMSPSAYITLRRIERAKALLIDSALSVTEIALEIGLSLSHFSRVFARSTGVSPSAFRVQHRS